MLRPQWWGGVGRGGAGRGCDHRDKCRPSVGRLRLKEGVKAGVSVFCASRERLPGWTVGAEHGK